MKMLSRVKKSIAMCMLVVFTLDLLCPVVAFALTSGPAQPEMKTFEPAGTTGLVDLFSGDFTYNIPLMDVGGYPVNIAYHSGSGMDDEASWVGAGWSLNPGAIDRQMRGLPDDFNGAGGNGDKIVKEFHLRNDITGGINFSFSPELFGFDVNSVAKIGAQAGIFYNNKRGLGIEFGLDANAPLLSAGKSTSGTNTAGLAASAGLNFNSQDGASFNPSVNLSVVEKNKNVTEKSASLNLGASLNSRTGLQYTTLGASYNAAKKETGHKDILQNEQASYVSYAAQPFIPETQVDYFNQSYSVAPQLGAEVWGFHPSVQLSGHYSIQKVAHPVSTFNAYGFLHSNKAKDDGKALMDFNREKDVPYFDGMPNLAIPVATPDLFMVNTQDGSGQYRAYLGGTGIFSDHDAVNTSVSASLGLEAGFGAGFKTGADVQASLNKTVTGKWKSGHSFLYEDNNMYQTVGNFTGNEDSKDAAYEPAYFKRVGEQVPTTGGLFQKLKGTLPVRIKTTGNGAGASAANILTGKDNSERLITDKLLRDSRETRNHVFSYLDAQQAAVSGLDKKIMDYRLLAGGFKPFLSQCAPLPAAAVITQAYKKDHHIGEITVTDEGGGRKVFGIPAYNTYQEDVSFNSDAAKMNAADKQKGLIAYDSKDASTGNSNGLDHYYSREQIPGYAHSFLLTAILSPDYVDVKGDGITDDDLGTAVKFNYWRKTNNYQWRTPYAAGKANYNEGLISDPADDRGNYSYGTKELWYLHSIESGNMVAVFETADREDGLGADAAGNKDKSAANRQQYLSTIRLFAKADWRNNPAAAVPIKTIHFEYDYSLFADAADIAKGVPNNSADPVANDNGQVINDHIRINQGGKLTLRKIYFTYQENTKGMLQPYEFMYDVNKPYAWKQYDRWGNYKNVDYDNPADVNNDYYPYSTQNKAAADDNAAAWQLTKIVTPAGGTIGISYESDDYSFVQNKKAMQMYPVAGVGDGIGQHSHYYETDKIYVQLPQPPGSDAALRALYFDGNDGGDSRNLFFKAFVKLADKDKYDYVAGYAEIENVQTDVRLAPGTSDVAEIRLKKIKGEGVTKAFHPIAKAAWQFMRLNTPSLVYPGYNVSESSGPMQFVKALLGAIGSISELLAPFDTRAALKQLAPEIDLSKSWVRLDAASNDSKKINAVNYCAKLGGGSRVKEISMNDEWNAMTGTAASASYATQYDYTTSIALADGVTITASSGVAGYEPLFGSEENPFHQPTSYTQNIRLGPDNIFFIDNPLCESYFPAANVGYSKVTVRNRGADGVSGSTGATINEFYTAKDFPTRVDHTPISVHRFGGASILQMLSIKKNNSRVVSQGYTVELNDMHGKPKSERILDRGGNEISAVYYYYSTDNQGAPEKTLNNNALLLQRDGSTVSSVIGQEIEMYSDMRSQTSFTAGVNVMLNVDAVYLLFAIVPIPTIVPLPNAQYTGFRSASTIKIIQQYGLLYKVVKRQNGSQVSTENLARDAETGEVLLTRTQNEFDDPVFSFHYPAHWIYDGMGPAYKNTGLALANFSATGGLITASASTQLLVAGDELLIKNNSGIYQRYWINKAGNTSPQRLVIIDEKGIPPTVLSNTTAIVIRSGRRNMQGMAAGDLLSMINPLKNGKLDLSVLTKVLDANGSVYNDEWAIEARNVLKTIMVCPDGYLTDASGKCYKEVEVPGTPVYAPNTAIYQQKSSLYGVCGSRITDNAAGYITIGAPEPAYTSITTIPFINGACNGTGANTENGPLNRCGIWAQGDIAFRNQWIGVRTKIFLRASDLKNVVPSGNTVRLYMGFGAQHNIEVRIDGTLVAAYGSPAAAGTADSYRYWRVKPINITLNTQHEIFIRTMNKSTAKGVMGVELYDNTSAQLRSAGCAAADCIGCTASAAALQLNESCSNGTNAARVVWSTDCLTEYDYFNYHANAAGVELNDFAVSCTNGVVPTDNARCNPQCAVAIQRVYTPKIPRSTCDFPAGASINPYTTGLRGNWRLQKSYGYHIDREAVLPSIKPGDPDVIEKTDIRKSGAYASFSPFWKYNGAAWLPPTQQTPRDGNWVQVNEVTVFNQKGHDVENADALGRYSAVQFGYLQTLATAVASNARYTDIGYDGFEDYDLDNGSCFKDSCNKDGHFSIRGLSSKFPAAIAPDVSVAHTGRNSLRVTGAVEAYISKSITPASANSLYSFTGVVMNLTDKGILTGFRPQAGKRYLLSAWIKDTPPLTQSPGEDNSQNVQLYANNEGGKAAVEISAGNVLIAQTTRAGPRVEGWRKVETSFSIPATATDIKIRFRPGSITAYFDDIRVQPFDAQMKTYAYDNRSMRLWAEMDENNFASFYEYDDEGTLIRVKKETERGIMTIKETRSSLRLKK